MTILVKNSLNKYVSIGGSSTPTTRFVPNFNATNQWATTNGNILILAGETLEMMVKVSSLSGGLNQFMLDSQFDSDPNRTAVFINSLGNYTGGSFTSELDGQPFSNGSPWPDTDLHHLKLTANSNVNIGTIAARANGTGSNFFGGNIYNLVVGDGTVTSFPMDDGWLNNPEMRNTGSGVNGAFNNMIELSWEEIPV